MPAILFGSISTVADTSELQREAFNDAFAAHDLDWRWEPAEYRQLLTTAGGAARIAAYARDRGVDVDAAQVHATKSKLFQERLATADLSPRPGVAEVLAGAEARGLRTALVTTTAPANVAALLAALGGSLGASPFAVTIDRDQVAEPKPDPEAYRLALTLLEVEAAGSVAIEDNVDGLAAARSADLPCVAFPNVGTAGHPFDGAAALVERLDLDELVGTAGSIGGVL